MKEQFIINLDNQKYQSFYESGAVFIEGFINNGPESIVGTWYVYFESGTKMMELAFINIDRTCNGSIKFYDEKGVLLRELIRNKDCSIEKRIKYVDSDLRYDIIDKGIYPFIYNTEEILKTFYYW